MRLAPFSRELRKDLAERLFLHFNMPGRHPLPLELSYPQLLFETGWSPDVLDKMPKETVEYYMIYKNVKLVAENGGSYNP